MKIIILMGSPNKKGSTNILVENFVKGAEEAGYDCEVIDVCHANIHPCTGCVACGYEGPCVQKDGVEQIKAKLLASDMVVFATPLYYYGMSAQLKTVVDRFCAYNSSLNSRHLKSALLKITELEDVVAQYQDEIESIRREKISADNVYNYLILFHDAYEQLPDIWKKKFFQSFIQEIQLYPEALENGQVLKSMKFKFPVFYQGQAIEEIRWDKENTVETVCLLSKTLECKAT